jgi:ribosomal protein S27AE
MGEEGASFGETSFNERTERAKSKSRRKITPAQEAERNRRVLARERKRLDELSKREKKEKRENEKKLKREKKDAKQLKKINKEREKVFKKTKREKVRLMKSRGMDMKSGEALEELKSFYEESSVPFVPKEKKKHKRKRTATTTEKKSSLIKKRSSSKSSSTSKKKKQKLLEQQEEFEAQRIAELAAQSLPEIYPSKLYMKIAEKRTELEKELSKLPELEAERDRLRAEHDALETRPDQPGFSRTHFRLKGNLMMQIETLETQIKKLSTKTNLAEFDAKVVPLMEADKLRRNIKNANERKGIERQNEMDKKVADAVSKFPLALWNSSFKEKLDGTQTTGFEKDFEIPSLPEVSAPIPTRKLILGGKKSVHKGMKKPGTLAKPPPTIEDFMMKSRVKDDNVRMNSFSASLNVVSGGSGYENFFDIDDCDEDQLFNETEVVLDDILEKRTRGTGVCPKIDVEDKEKCSRCCSIMRTVAHESRMECGSCGLVVKYLDSTSAAVGFGNEVEFTSFSYTRSSHFNEWLNKVQGKETTQVKPEILEKIMMYLYMEKGILDEKEITPKIVKDAMKALNLKEQYEYLSQVCYKITGKPPPRMSPDLEEQCRMMFLAIQTPFAKHRPSGRKNFLSYAFCLYKFCELLGFREFLKYFSLLKGPEKLQKQDYMWHCICNDLDWQFIPSKREFDPV